jgi:hypothetical protein
MTRVILDHGGLSPDALADALESAKKNKYADLVELLEKSGAKPRAEFTIEPAALARYAGTYRSASGTELALTVVDGHLTSGPEGRRLTLVARDATRFGAPGMPGFALTFHLEQDRVTSVAVGQGPNPTIFMRVEGK